MSYFNGRPHGFNHPSKGFIAPVPMTQWCCDNCAPHFIPGWDKSAPAGQEHWKTEFSWGPWALGDDCPRCKKAISDLVK